MRPISAFLSLWFLLAASGAPLAAPAPTEPPDKSRYLGEFDKRFGAAPTPIQPKGAVPDKRRYESDFLRAEDVPAPVAGAAPERAKEQVKEHVSERAEEPPKADAPKTVVISSTTPSKPKSSAAVPFVPPGFEELLEPQTTIVDVYYGGAYLTATPATYTPSNITFLSPDDIISRIPDILEPETATTILASDMATNSELICLSRAETGCGSIEAETIEVIFDDGRFRADVFIAPDMLSVRSASVAKFLPRSSAGWSLLNTSSAAVNGAEGRSSNYNIGNSTTLAFRENRLIAVSNVTRDESLTVDTLALQREINGRQFQAGIFRSSPGNLVFLRQADYQGISIASSLDTRQDLDQSAGNAIQVFLDTRSRVDIIKDGRLVSTAVYDTGNQIIDTSQLPGGAYEITLRIRDNFGIESEETRFYVKTNRLPPKDQSLYFVDFGESVEREINKTLPVGTGERFVRAGFARRLTDNFGGEMGIFANEDETLFEAGLFQLGRTYDLRLNAAVGTDDSRGLSLNGRTRLGVATVNSSLRRIWSDQSDSILGAALTQASLNVAFPLAGGTISVTGRYNDRDSGTDQNIGVRYDFPSLRFGNRFLTSNLQITRDNGSVQYLLGARLALRGKRWNTQLVSRLYRDEPEMAEQDQGVISEVVSTWQDGDKYLSDVTFIMRASDGQIDRTLESELDISAGLGRANMEVVYSAETEQMSYGGSFFTSLIANAESVAIGARQQGQSAIVLDISGDEENAYFDVEINDMNRGTARIGARTIIGLTPFKTYEVDLVPRGDSIVDFDTRTQRATLYPGNVVTLDWAVTKVVIAFGQIRKPSGEPVTNAVIDGVIGLATTDDFGLFQAEFNSDVTSLNVRTREETCTVTLPDYDAEQMMVTLGELICR